MGFNPRLAPYSLSTALRFVASSAMAATTQYQPLFRFPFQGQLIGAYTNVTRTYADAGTKDAAIDAATDSVITEVSILKHAADDTTLTYATGLRAAILTGANDTSTGGGIDYKWPTTSGGTGLTAMTNKTATRRTFVQGDQAIVKFTPTWPTNAHYVWRVDLQMDYIIGQESA
ncbi:MAG TPA: hypothetical protein VNA25_19425 [Phycisphaerae bacterium]|nr:hypothetical protein [Phycisphaerae bacterium]